MTGSKRDADEQPTGGVGDEPQGEGLAQAEGAAASADVKGDTGDEGDEDDEFDLSDLDAKGVEGLVAEYEAEQRPTPGRRPGWISVAVIVLALPLLVRMYPDFRYWLASSEPTDLGTAAEFVRDGQVPAGFHERHVILRGTPDVRNVAVAKGKDDTIRYMRLKESEGQLFAVVRSPKADDKFGSTVTYPGRFEGRLTRLGSIGQRSWVPWSEPDQYKWLSRFYEIENITRTIDSDAASLGEALRGSSSTLTIATTEGDVRLGPNDRVRLVVALPEVSVSLGGDSFGPKRAHEAMQSLGVPFLKIAEADYAGQSDKQGTLGQTRARARHRYVARIPAERREAAVAALEAKAIGDIEEANIRQGVNLMPRSATFTVPVADLELQGDTVRFARGNNTATVGFEVSGDTLKPAAEGDLVTVPLDKLEAVRVDKPIRLDPNGYAIIDGETPSSQWMFGVMWLFILAVTLVNAVGVALWVRRWARAADA